MAKGFTPIIGLAVVVALALAAVFGAMAIANPAMAQSDEAIENLAVDSIGNNTVVLRWDAISSHTATANYEARWVETGDTVTGAWISGNGNFDVDVSGTSIHKATINTLMDGSTNLTNDRSYTFYIRSAANTSIATVMISATPSAPPEVIYSTALAATAVTDTAGAVELTWTATLNDNSVAVAKWEYQVKADGMWMDTGLSGVGAKKYTVTGLDAGTDVPFNVRPVSEKGATGNAAVANSASPTQTPKSPELTADSSTPGAATRYTVVYDATSAVEGGNGQIKLEMEDFGVPASISTDDVIIRVKHDPDGSSADTDTTNDAGDFDQPSHPQGIETDDEEIVLTIGDTDPDEASGEKGVQGIAKTDRVTIIIQSDAGVTLPTEGGMYAWKVAGADTDNVHVKRKVSLDEDDGGRGDMLEAKGKGFKNGTSLHFWLDTNEDGMPDASEFTLCSTVVGSDDVGSCTFEVTVPPFVGGMNYVNAVDGRNNKADSGEHHEFELTSSITATPNGGTPGESMLVELFDIPETAGNTITKVELARVQVCGSGTYPNGATVPGCKYAAVNEGNASFRLTIPDWAPGGVQDLRVTVGSGNVADSPSKTVTITPPTVRATPSTVVANQRISLVGAGFNPRARICDSNYPDAVVSIGSHNIECERVNGGDPVSVDNGGNWSAAVDLPLDDSTVDEGTYAIRVRDSLGRAGQVEVTIPARTVTITPESGRVGTMAVVRGENWPSKNDEGDSFNVEIVYESAHGRSTVSANPDASGRFEAELRIPTTAGIPSTNTVKVSYEFGVNNAIRTTAVTHQVPEGAINLSTTSGAPGTVVSISGVGFKSYVPVTSVFVGALDVTPSPKPSTDAQGMVNFDMSIPGLDEGIQTVEVKIGQTTASTGFTVTPSGVNPGDITASAKAVENLGDNFVRAFHFNNDTKMWAFYDPMVAEDSTLMNFITGESYLMLVSSTTEVILNGKTRNLTCVGDNCWNQIVW